MNEPDLFKTLVLGILKQALEDYLFLSKISYVVSRQNYASAKGFLFDDKYTVTYGDLTFSARELLSLADLDIDFVRRLALEKEKFLEENEDIDRHRGMSLLDDWSKFL